MGTFQWVEDVKTVAVTLAEMKARMDSGGLWYVVTGNHFTTSLANFAYNSADVFLGGTVVMGLVAMAGSKRAAKGVYWACAGYLILNVVASAFKI